MDGVLLRVVVRVLRGVQLLLPVSDNEGLVEHVGELERVDTVGLTVIL